MTLFKRIKSILQKPQTLEIFDLEITSIENDEVIFELKPHNGNDVLFGTYERNKFPRDIKVGDIFICKTISYGELTTVEIQ